MKTSHGTSLMSEPKTALTVAEAASRRDSTIMALVICTTIVSCYWGYWTLFPNLTAGSVGNDALFLLDGARRIAAGQVPHVDFSLPTGVLPYLIYLVAERSFPHFPAYIGSHLIGFVLLCPILIPAMVQMPRKSMAFALAGVVAIATLLPFNTAMGDPYGIAFYASYNRFSTALTLAYFAWLFRTGQSSPWHDGLIVAYALLLAFYLKIVLVVVVVAPLAVLAVLDRRWCRMALAGFAVAGLALAGLELIGGWVRPYIADIGAMSRINAGAAPYFLASFLFKTFIPQALVAILILWLLLTQWHASGRSFASTAPALAMIAGVGALSFAESQATGGLEFAGALGLLFTPGLAGRTTRRSLLAATVALIAGPLVIGAFENTMAVMLGRQGKSVDVAWVTRYLPHTRVPEPMLRKAMATASLWEKEGAMGRTLQTLGPELVDRSARDLYLAQWASVDHALRSIPEDQLPRLGAVATLANVDLFGLALGAEPAKGIKIVHDVGRTIRPLDARQASAYLAAANTVFEPTCLINEAPGFEGMSRWFAPTLAAEFSARILTPCWTMHSRQRQSKGL